METESKNSYQGFQCHAFDSKTPACKCRIKFRPTVFKPNEPQRGTHNVCSGIYTVDESKLNDLLKINLLSNIASNCMYDANEYY